MVYGSIAMSFTKSATPATPVTRKPLDATTWTRDWFTPLEFPSTSSVRLMGWIKGGRRADPIVNGDVFQFEKNIEVEEAPVKTEPTQGDADLKLALSLDKKDDQISSLSGLGI